MTLSSRHHFQESAKLINKFKDETGENRSSVRVSSPCYCVDTHGGRKTMVHMKIKVILKWKELKKYKPSEEKESEEYHCYDHLPSVYN